MLLLCSLLKAFYIQNMSLFSGIMTPHGQFTKSTCAARKVVKRSILISALRAHAGDKLYLFRTSVPRWSSYQYANEALLIVRCWRWKFKLQKHRALIRPKSWCHCWYAGLLFKLHNQSSEQSPLCDPHNQYVACCPLTLCWIQNKGSFDTDKVRLLSVFGCFFTVAGCGKQVKTGWHLVL